MKFITFPFFFTLTWNYLSERFCKLHSDVMCHKRLKKSLMGREYVTAVRFCIQLERELILFTKLFGYPKIGMQKKIENKEKSFDAMSLPLCFI